MHNKDLKRPPKLKSISPTMPAKLNTVNMEVKAGFGATIPRPAQFRAEHRVSTHPFIIISYYDDDVYFYIVHASINLNAQCTEWYIYLILQVLCLQSTEWYIFNPLSPLSTTAVHITVPSTAAKSGTVAIVTLNHSLVLTAFCLEFYDFGHGCSKLITRNNCVSFWNQLIFLCVWGLSR